MNRTATVLAATVAALLLSASPAMADDAPVITDPLTGEVVAYEDCWNEPYEGADGLACTSMAEAERQGLLECKDETVEYEPGVWTCEKPRPEPEPEAASPVEPSDEPDPEPVVEIVEDNGGWGWSDAREAYRG